jgi:hypothetical protein
MTSTKFTERWQAPAEVTESGLYLMWHSGLRGRTEDPVGVRVKVNADGMLVVRRNGYPDESLPYATLQGIDSEYRLLGPFRGPCWGEEDE